MSSIDRVLAGVVAAAAGMALSMGFKILGQYRSDPVALILAAATLVAMEVFHVPLVPVVLVAGVQGRTPPVGGPLDGALR